MVQIDLNARSLLLPRTERPSSTLKQFLYSNTSIPALALCSYRYRCNRPLCPDCSARKARMLRSRLLDVIEPGQLALFVRLSVASAYDLDTAWSDLASTRSAFGRQCWLKKTSEGWARTTELTYRATGWNMHDNLLVTGTRDQLENVRETIVSRWLGAAESMGVQAGVAAQYVEYAHSVPAVRHYIAKGLMSPAADASAGRTPGDLLHAFHTGDADAGELWAELEGFGSNHPRGLIWTNRGGSMREYTKRDMDLAA